MKPLPYFIRVRPVDDLVLAAEGLDGGQTRVRVSYRPENRDNIREGGIKLCSNDPLRGELGEARPLFLSSVKSGDTQTSDVTAHNQQGLACTSLFQEMEGLS